jgi:hypothetical protein
VNKESNLLLLMFTTIIMVLQYSMREVEKTPTSQADAILWMSDVRTCVLNSEEMQDYTEVTCSCCCCCSGCGGGVEDVCSCCVDDCVCCGFCSVGSLPEGIGVVEFDGGSWWFLPPVSVVGTITFPNWTNLNWTSSTLHKKFFCEKVIQQSTES